jgi:hypothetical protein
MLVCCRPWPGKALYRQVLRRHAFLPLLSGGVWAEWRVLVNKRVLTSAVVRTYALTQVGGVRFRNQAHRPMKLYWVSHDGKPVTMTPFTHALTQTSLTRLFPFLESPYLCVLRGTFGSLHMMSPRQARPEVRACDHSSLPCI